MEGSKAPLVSVCVANYNGNGFLGRCLEAIYAQETQFPFEVIVHDDASQDDSVSFLKNNYTQVTLIESDVNVGYCVSNNRMAECARGEYLLLVNNDAVLWPDAINVLARYAITQPKDKILGLAQYDLETGDLIDCGKYLDLFMNPIPNRRRSKRRVAMVIGACLWVPVELWQRLGGFPEWFESIAEDGFLCGATWLTGGSVEALWGSGYFHAVGRSFGGGKRDDGVLRTPMRRRQLSERNKNFCMLSLYPMALLVIVFPIHLAMLLVEGIILAIWHRKLRLITDIYLQSITQIWSYRDRLRALRDRIQSKRNTTLSRFLSLFRLYPYKLLMLFKYGKPTIT